MLLEAIFLKTERDFVCFVSLMCFDILKRSLHHLHQHYQVKIVPSLMWGVVEKRSQLKCQLVEMVCWCSSCKGTSCVLRDVTWHESAVPESRRRDCSALCFSHEESCERVESKWWNFQNVLSYICTTARYAWRVLSELCSLLKVKREGRKRETANAHQDKLLVSGRQKCITFT